MFGGSNVDSARQNLASSVVNGFVNAGFGQVSRVKQPQLVQTGAFGMSMEYLSRKRCKTTSSALLNILGFSVEANNVYYIFYCNIECLVNHLR